MSRSRSRSRSKSKSVVNKNDTGSFEVSKKKVSVIPSLGQNKSQRLKLLTFLYYDGHKTFNTALSGCLLLLFSNQRCGDKENGYYECEWHDGLEKYHYKNWFRQGNSLESIGMILNIISLIMLFITFYYEFKRENVFIDKLEVNKNLSQTDAEVEKALEKMSERDLHLVLRANRKYQVAAKVTTIIMAINVVLSAIILIFFHYYNFTTVTHLYQLLLYIYPKWDQLKENASSSKYKFVSAYMKTKVQFNDCDPNVDVTRKKLI